MGHVGVKEFLSLPAHCSCPNPVTKIHANTKITPLQEKLQINLAEISPGSFIHRVRIAQFSTLLLDAVLSMQLKKTYVHTQAAVQLFDLGDSAHRAAMCIQKLQIRPSGLCDEILELGHGINNCCG